MSRFISKRFDRLEEYVPGEQPQDMKYIKLNTNESPYSPDEAAKEAIDGEIAQLKLYPDPEGKRLRAKLAGLYGVNPENVLLSNGSDEMLFFYFTAFCDAAHPVVFPDLTYGFYPVYAELLGLDYTEIPLREDFTIDCSQYYGIGKNIVIANPNAPTGISIGLDEIEKILDSNPDNVVLIDEAYVDFGGKSCVELIARHDNLLVVQTFSKSRSMAGARLGYALADAGLIRDLNKIKYSFNPYNINRLTLAAGEAALDRNAYYMDNCQKIIDCREHTALQLKAMGYMVTDSCSNFLFAKSPRLSGQQVYEGLKKRGVLVRHFNKERIRDWLRITVGTPAEMETLLAELNTLEEAAK